jgi:hypothetical protein
MASWLRSCNHSLSLQQCHSVMKSQICVHWNLGSFLRSQCTRCPICSCGQTSHWWWPPWDSYSAKLSQAMSLGPWKVMLKRLHSLPRDRNTCSPLASSTSSVEMGWSHHSDDDSEPSGWLNRLHPPWSARAIHTGMWYTPEKCYGYQPPRNYWSRGSDDRISQHTNGTSHSVCSWWSSVSGIWSKAG